MKLPVPSFQSSQYWTRLDDSIFVIGAEGSSPDNVSLFDFSSSSPSRA